MLGRACSGRRVLRRHLEPRPPGQGGRALPRGPLPGVPWKGPCGGLLRLQPRCGPGREELLQRELGAELGEGLPRSCPPALGFPFCNILFFIQICGEYHARIRTSTHIHMNNTIHVAFFQPRFGVLSKAKHAGLSKLLGAKVYGREEHTHACFASALRPPLPSSSLPHSWTRWRSWPSGCSTT